MRKYWIWRKSIVKSGSFGYERKLRADHFGLKRDRVGFFAPLLIAGKLIDGGL